ncbi:MAG: rhodanese-like domain-containing protein [Burkholderiaceae bacterium]|nr:rhodanese-like domain-containing protein [Burkholderiaceae bacterium]MDZ4163439.1 rhodanese-like domain-containing protein [Burkholderiales bacterium]
MTTPAPWLPQGRWLPTPAFTLVGLVLVLALSSALAVESAQVPDDKRSATGLHLTAVEAAAMKRADPAKVLFIDVRSRAEAMLLGMPTLADHLVPLLDFSAPWEWSADQGEYLQQANPRFVQDVEQRLTKAGLTKNDPVILLCRSGTRSNSAAGLLSLYGFKKAYTVIDGYEGDLATSGPQAGQRSVNGWKNAKLPWTYQLDSTKVYRE